MADSLETLFKHLGPNTAAMWAGEREALNKYQMEAATAYQQQQVQDLVQANAQRELTNPLEVQSKQLANRGLEAGLPGIGADSRKKTMQADTYAATQKGTIESTNNKNDWMVLENNIKRNDALVDVLGKGAKALSQLPAPARHAAAYKQILAMGGQSALDTFKDKLDTISADKLPAFIDAMAQSSAMGSVGMRQELEKLHIQGEKQKDLARIAASTRMYEVDQRRETAAATAAAKAERDARVKTLEDDVVKNLTAARAEKDPAKQAIFYAQAAQSAKLKAEIPGYGKVNSGEVANMPTNPISPLGPVTDTTTPSGKPLPPGWGRLN